MVLIVKPCKNAETQIISDRPDAVPDARHPDGRRLSAADPNLAGAGAGTYALPFGRRGVEAARLFSQSRDSGLLGGFTDCSFYFYKKQYH